MPDDGPQPLPRQVTPPPHATRHARIGAAACRLSRPTPCRPLPDWRRFCSEPARFCFSVRQRPDPGGTMKHAIPFVLLLAVIPAAAVAQDVEAGGRETITIRGILGASFYMQDALFGLGNGQKAQFVAEELEDDAWWHGGDARNVRLTLAFAGPEVMTDWRANAMVELDFFGPFASGGNFGDEQPLPRLRHAWAELTNGRTTVRFGQDFALTWGNLPVSTSHIGFPL